MLTQVDRGGGGGGGFCQGGYVLHSDGKLSKLVFFFQISIVYRVGYFFVKVNLYNISDYNIICWEQVINSLHTGM